MTQPRIFIDCRPVTNRAAEKVLAESFPKDRYITLHEAEYRLDRDQDGVLEDDADFDTANGVYTRSEFIECLSYLQNLDPPLVDLRERLTLAFYFQLGRMNIFNPQPLEPKTEAADREITGIIAAIPINAFQESALWMAGSAERRGKIEIRQGDRRTEQCLTLDFAVDDRDGRVIEIDPKRGVGRLLELYGYAALDATRGYIFVTPSQP